MWLQTAWCRLGHCRWQRQENLHSHHGPRQPAGLRRVRPVRHRWLLDRRQRPKDGEAVRMARHDEGAGLHQLGVPRAEQHFWRRLRWDAVQWRQVEGRRLWPEELLRVRDTGQLPKWNKKCLIDSIMSTWFPNADIIVSTHWQTSFDVDFMLICKHYNVIFFRQSIVSTWCVKMSITSPQYNVNNLTNILSKWSIIIILWLYVIAKMFLKMMIIKSKQCCAL